MDQVNQVHQDYSQIESKRTDAIILQSNLNASAYYICFKVEEEQYNDPNFQKINYVRFFNILKPKTHKHQSFHYLDYMYHPQSDLSVLIQDMTVQQRLVIALQIYLIFDEFIIRNLQTRDINLSHFYFVDGQVYVYSFEIYKQREVDTNQYFINYQKIYYQLFQNDLNCNQNEVIDYLIEKIKIEKEYKECPYIEIIQLIFNIKSKQPIGSTIQNSYIYSISTPKIFKQIYNIDAAKIIIKSTKMQYGALSEKNVKRELDIMEMFSIDEQVVTCYSYVRIKSQLFLFMEQYDGDLTLLFSQQFSESQIYDIGISLFTSLKHVHKKEIFHCDIKPQNIFIKQRNDEVIAYLADFDNSKIFTPENNLMSERLSSSSYLTPEDFSEYSYTSDVWQLGLTLLQLANKGKLPFKGAYIEDYKKTFCKENILNRFQENDLSYRYEFIELLECCLDIQQQRRPQAHQVIDMLIKLQNQYLKSSIQINNVISPNRRQKQKSYKKRQSEEFQWSGIEIIESKPIKNK